jgi:predicted Zn-dependent peptidase
MSYQTHTLANGIRIIFEPAKTVATYCGMIVDVGSRDEADGEFGMAHFVEHLLFKGTQKRNSRQIINYLESVGGEMNAYTSKEETVVYASVLNEYAERAVELIGDVVLNSIFPQREMDKEREIILDEILSYKDSPSELIFDDFEEQLFNNHALAHNILGCPKFLKKCKTATVLRFFTENYTPEKMIFFLLGDFDFKKIIRWAEKYFIAKNTFSNSKIRLIPENFIPENQEFKRKTHQVHYMLGNRAYPFSHPDYLAFYLLNNLLGGTGMNSLLNLSLREKSGLVYQVEANYQPFTDSGVWSVYFGCDAADAARCEKLVMRELKHLREKSLSDKMLKQYKLQLMGQLAISNEINENRALHFGKSFLRFEGVRTLPEIREALEKVTAKKLQDIANEIFNEKEISLLKYV